MNPMSVGHLTTLKVMSDGEIIFTDLPDISALEGRFSDYSLNTLVANRVPLEKTPTISETNISDIENIAKVVEKEFENK